MDVLQSPLMKETVGPSYQTVGGCWQGCAQDRWKMRRVGLAASLSVGMMSERHVEVVERSHDLDKPYALV